MAGSGSIRLLTSWPLLLVVALAQARTCPLSARKKFFDFAAENGTAMEAFKDAMTKHDHATVSYNRPFLVSTTWAKDVTSTASCADEMGEVRAQHWRSRPSSANGNGA